MLAVIGTLNSISYTTKRGCLNLCDIKNRLEKSDERETVNDLMRVYLDTRTIFDT